MWETVLQIACANFAASLIPGQNLALMTTGLASGGIEGGLRAVIGITAAKMIWATGTVAFLPLVMAADADVLTLVQLFGGAALACVGLCRLIRAVSAAPRLSGNPFSRSFVGALVNPMTCVFFLSVFPVLAVAQPMPPPAFGPLCLLAIMATTLLALLPWFALGLAAFRIHPQVLRSVSGGILLLVGATLVVGVLR